MSVNGLPPGIMGPPGAMMGEIFYLEIIFTFKKILFFIFYCFIGMPLGMPPIERGGPPMGLPGIRGSSPGLLRSGSLTRPY